MSGSLNLRKAAKSKKKNASSSKAKVKKKDKKEKKEKKDKKAKKGRKEDDDGDSSDSGVSAIPQHFGTLSLDMSPGWYSCLFFVLKLALWIELALLLIGWS